jgi:hypothetical protein
LVHAPSASAPAAQVSTASDVPLASNVPDATFFNEIDEDDDDDEEDYIDGQDDDDFGPGLNDTIIANSTASDDVDAQLKSGAMATATSGVAGAVFMLAAAMFV